MSDYLPAFVTRAYELALQGYGEGL